MITDAKLYQAFYTNSTPIVDYMVEKLQLKTTDRILEPCGGEGVFVGALLDQNPFTNLDVYELNASSVEILKKKFSSFPNVTIHEKDTLLDNDLIFNSNFGGVYDKIIANPPYGAWQDYEKREKLKKLYPNMYTKETYGLFLYQCINLLKEGGILSFIIPDTFLNLHMHRALRTQILEKTKIIELALFPSSYFPGVNFGYANLSIITLEKVGHKREGLENSFHVYSGFSKVEQLKNINSEDLKVYSFTQKQILSNSDYAFFIAENSAVPLAINSVEVKIGDIANCVTGFYSGNDKKFLQVINSDLKNGKNYDLVDINKITRDISNQPNILEGVDSEKHFISIVKGGNTKYFKSEGWFMNWSKEAVNHYKTDKKARFQNPQFYFKFGIGVPMISSSSITASLIENKLFDQSIVGIFPKDKSLTYYLLAFFNSPTCNELIRTINPSANNPANYIKKIPFVKPKESLKKKVDNIVQNILISIKEDGKYCSVQENELHLIIKNIYGF